MTKARVVALAALFGLLAGCGGGDDDQDRGAPQAADGGGSGGCEESHRSESEAWQSEQPAGERNG